jgi:hypothetical protein
MSMRLAFTRLRDSQSTKVLCQVDIDGKWCKLVEGFDFEMEMLGIKTLSCEIRELSSLSLQ